MDPLSITASVAGLATLAYQIIGYLGSVRAGGKERLDLTREVTNLWMSITSLLEQLHPDKLKDDKVPDSLRPLFEPDGILKEIRQQLEELERKIKSQSSHGKIAQSLAWPFTQKDAEKLTQRIYRLKSLLQDGINQSTHALAQDIYRDGQSVKNAVDEKQLRELIDWISPLNFVAKQSMIWNEHHKGTCTWFLERHEFREWREGENTRLFCPGIPGAGKTFLASIVYNELEAMRVREEGGLKGAAVIMLYCKWDDPLSQDPNNLLSSIIKQFVQRYNVGVDNMMELFKKHSKDGTRPSRDQLTSTLSLLMRRFTKVFIVLDGLDELKNENERLPLLSTLAPWVAPSSTSEAIINLMVTSRPLPNIGRHFRHLDSPDSYIICDTCNRENLTMQYHCAECETQYDESYDLCPPCYLDMKRCAYKGHSYYLQFNARVVPIAAVAEDLATYVRWKTSASDFLHQCTETTEGLMDLILDTVVKNNGGMFLLAKFNMDTLDAKLNVKQVRAALNSLPQELDGTYEDAMLRITELAPSTRASVMQFLLWVVFAEQPLHEQAIEHALAVKEGNADIDADDIIRARILANKCAGLVQFDESDCLRLVHYSAEDYFRENRERWFPDGHSYVASSCLAYLHFDVFRAGACAGPSEAFDFENRLQKYPFLRYASVSWGRHLRDAKTDQLYDRTIALLAEPGCLGTIAQALWYLDDQQESMSWSAKNGSAVHLAVHFNLPRLVEALINRGFDPDIKDLNGVTPLSLAVRRNQMEVLAVLTKAGASVNTIDNSGRAALHRAILDGNSDIVELLLAQKGVDVNISHERWSHFTPLIVAATVGSVKGLKMLLSNKNIQVNKTCSAENSTALIHAAKSGPVGPVQVLLDHPGIDINHKDSSGNSALTSASDRGHGGVVEALLRKGADTEVKQEGSNGTAIMRAIDNGYTSVVQLLMKAGTDLHHKDCFDRGILHSAAVNHRAEIIRILLAYDPTLDVNMQDINGMTTMHDVARAGALEALEVLLEHGGDPSIKDKYGRTPILIAHEAHHMAVLETLRAARARQKAEGRISNGLPQRTETGTLIDDVKRSDTGLSIPGTLPLWSLVRAKQFTELKERLPDADKDEINTTEPDMGQSALHWAISERDVQTARLLLDHGADINLQNKYGRSSVHIAVMAGHLESVQMLLEAGANPNLKDIWDCTPLSMVNNVIGVLLVEYGADIDRDNHYMGHYLRLAAQSNWEKSVRRLIAAGADVWGKDGNGKTPYMIAKEKGHDELANLILQLAPEGAQPLESAGKPAESGSGNEKPAVASSLKNNQTKLKGEQRILEKSSPDKILLNGSVDPAPTSSSTVTSDAKPTISLFGRHIYTLLLILLLITATTLARLY
ncbi:ankyrin repeat-containing domain protein [Aspergillus undulatus]|uniref:ankyrin repeat-containing domain protein n=1 Tax=Aspergillus undulatus TaxID=1810928 RepID=UPI003CCD8FC6